MRYRGLVVLVLVGWLGALLVVNARANFFWHDEVYTALTSQLTLSTLWRAGLDGADLSPPLNTMLTHAVHLVAGTGPVQTRLPPIAGYLAASALLFLTVSRRSNAIVGLGAALLIASTPAWNYGYQARAYGLSLGWCALALYAWSEAAAGRRAAFHWMALAVAVAASVWTHYFAVLVLLPVGLGEAVRQWRLRRFVPAPWIAMALGVAAVLPLWGHIAVASSHRGTFWARPALESVAEVYPFILKDIPDRTVALALVGLIVVVEIARRGRTRRATRRLSPEDLAACLGCLALPLAAFALGYTTHAFTTRYLVFATVAFAFAVPLVLWAIMPDTGVGDVVLAGALLLPVVTMTAAIVRDPPPAAIEPGDRRWLIEWLRGPDPMVLTGGLDFLGVWYHLPDSVRAKAAYAADPVSEIAETGADTVDANYLALARWTPVPVVRLEEFMRTHPTFLLYAFGHSWPERRLRDAGATLTEVVREPEGNGTLYRVTLRRESSR